MFILGIYLYQVFGVSKDMSPLYRLLLHEHRKENPTSLIGEPGEMQGVNTGVLLLNLEKMRSSDEFNKFLDSRYLEQSCGELQFKSYFGDQVKVQKPKN